jgi:hypothetical protein
VRGSGRAAAAMSSARVRLTWRRASDRAAVQGARFFFGTVYQLGRAPALVSFHRLVREVVHRSRAVHRSVSSY